MKKKILLIILSVFCLNVVNAQVTWELSEDGTLTISGTGEMDDYYKNPYSTIYSTAPWAYYKDEIKNIIIKNGVTSIGAFAFYNYEVLTSITISNSVTSIKNSAFEGCSALNSITIPNSVTSIGYSTFKGCSALTSITIPSSVTSIGNSAFSGCSELSLIDFPNVTNCRYIHNEFDDTKWFKNADDYVYLGDCLYRYKGNGETATIKNGTKAILQNAFENCNNLTTVTIPNSVTSIGDCAFYGCSGLSSVTIPNSVTSISGQTFYGCSNLTSITIPSSVISIYYGAFENCSGLTSVTIPNGVTSIYDYTFSGCSSLTTITIPNSVTSIGNSAFSGCSHLTSVTIPNSVTSIDQSAFSGCSGLTSITIPKSVTYIGKSAFSGCDNLVELNYYARNADLPESFPTTIKTVTIGNEVEKIPSFFLRFNKNVTSITIPNSVTSIGKNAFSDCIALTSITIPNSVTSIGENAFSDCIALTSITIPNSVINIDEYAFAYCVGLTSVTIPNGVTSIYDYTFRGCSGLTTITIPNSVTSIGDSAFRDCSSLTSVTIPNSVTNIGVLAFDNCYRIREVYSLNAAPPNAYNAFTGMNAQHAKVFVPEGAADAYKYAKGWMDFLNIYETTFSTVLTPAEPITISDNVVEIATGYYKEKTVTYVREGDAISKDNYASFCLPFDVDPTDAQFKAVYVPVGMALYNTEQNTLRIGFYKEDKIIPAGTPFLALLAVDDKVEIKNALPVNYEQKTPAVKSCVVRTYNFNDHGGIMSENSDYAINFSGTYKKVSPANANTFNTDGSIGASANVVPYRAYVSITKNGTNAKIITSFDEETVTTGINDLQITNDELPVYDLNGRMVNGNTLKSGIYIKNGKKFIK